MTAKRELACEEVHAPSDPQPEIDDERHVRLWGGLDPPPNWAEYLDDFDPAYRPYIEAARRWLEAREDGIPMAGDWCLQPAGDVGGHARSRGPLEPVA